MAQVKIYGLRSALASHRVGLSAAIHQALVEVLQLPLEKRFQRFFALEEQDFLFPEDRSPAYTVIEISMFAGRSVPIKKALVRAIFQQIQSRCGIAPQDIEITIFETAKENWGIRGQHGDELSLTYRTDI